MRIITNIVGALVIALKAESDEAQGSTPKFEFEIPLLPFCFDF